MGNALPLIAKAMNLFKVACIVLEKPMYEQGLSVLGLYPFFRLIMVFINWNSMTRIKNEF